MSCVGESPLSVSQAPPADASPRWALPETAKCASSPDQAQRVDCDPAPLPRFRKRQYRITGRGFEEVGFCHGTWRILLRQRTFASCAGTTDHRPSEWVETWCVSHFGPAQECQRILCGPLAFFTTLCRSVHLSDRRLLEILLEIELSERSSTVTCAVLAVCLVHRHNRTRSQLAAKSSRRFCAWRRFSHFVVAIFVEG